MTIDVDTFNEKAIFHGVKGLIRVDGKIIAIQRDSGTLHEKLHMDLPGGARERQESPFETLVREVREELGFKLKKEDILYARRYHNPPDQRNDTFVIATNELSIDERKIVFGEKGIGFHFMTIHDFIHHPKVVEKQRLRVIDYLTAVRDDLDL